MSGLKLSVNCLFTVVIPAFFMIGLSGCQKGPKRPAFNPRKSAKEALQKFDSDGDGILNEEEIGKCPGLLAALPRVDADGDGSVSADEIAKRVKYYKSAPVAVISGSVKVTYKGKPLSDATITFEPEEFLGDEFKSCSGVTDDRGNAYLNRDEAAEFPGLYLGFYRVKISKIEKGQEKIPAEYNTDSTLGYEAAHDIEMVSDVPTFHVK